VNTQQHAHELQVRYARQKGWGWTFLDYGDQDKMVSNARLLYDWRIRRAVRRMVRSHARGSLAAHESTAIADRARAVATQEADRIAAYWNGKP
jgi:hypothetical protein